MRLVIETAGPACSVALLDDDDVAVASFHELVGRGHAERLVPMIAELPGGGRADAILVDRGPGSFTGIRVGIAAARALGLGWGVPVQAYESLSLLAALHFAQSDAAQATIAIPGGHGELFVQRFAAAPFGALGPPQSIPAAEVAGDDLVHADPERLDARTVALLPDARRRLPSQPLYIRGADAKPMA